MKNILLVLTIAVTMISCDKEVLFPIHVDQGVSERTLEGRWVLEGFDQSIRYEFTKDKRFTLYASNGEFPSLAHFMELNPSIHGNDWKYNGNTVVVDLNFGNYSRLVPNFKCNNKVINWTAEDGTPHSTFYREGHDIAACN